MDRLGKSRRGGGGGGDGGGGGVMVSQNKEVGSSNPRSVLSVNSMSSHHLIYRIYFISVFDEFQQAGNSFKLSVDFSWKNFETRMCLIDYLKKIHFFAICHFFVLLLFWQRQKCDR